MSKPSDRRRYRTDEDAHSNASVARMIANAAVYGLRETKESATTIREELECLDSTKSRIKDYLQGKHA